MARLRLTLCASAAALLAAGGCAAPQPVPFQLVDAATRIQRGLIFTDSQRIEATVDDRLFSGFYIVATGSAFSQSLMGRRFWPRETVTTFSSNSARAQLTAAGGQQLSCEFLFEDRRALGECRTPAGAVFQLIADGK
jgi:hypothetical protein